MARNPMYVGVLLIVIGWALGLRSSPIGRNAIILAVLLQLRVVFGEEPWLAKRYGADWAEYRKRVPHWVLWVRVRQRMTSLHPLRGL